MDNKGIPIPIPPGRRLSAPGAENQIPIPLSLSYPYTFENRIPIPSKTKFLSLHRLRRLIKHVADRCLAVVGLLFLSPVMLIIAVAIYLKMGRPVFFSQPRPGRDGKIFIFYKFRTMVPDPRDKVADQPDYAGSAPPDAQRIVPLGHFLRKTSLDELPQLWNVLKGEMSFVGPRPLRVYYLSRYSPVQARRHEVKPGITGWTQIKGRNSLSWEEKFALDVWYVDHWSLWLDLKILFFTVFMVWQQEGISKEGAYTEEVFQGRLEQPRNRQGRTKT
jgi:lipopolysaccharide/colanic/teichoic acid biosynthesis glycosyltransferase